MKITPSMLSAYLYCPRKLFLSYVMRLKEPPKEAMVKGTVRHETYDHINKSEEQLVTSIKKKPDGKWLLGLYKKHYIGILRNVVLNNKNLIKSVNLAPAQVFQYTLPYILEESMTRAFNILNFINKTNLYGKRLWEALTPKIKSEIAIESDILQLKGIVDQVEIYRDGYVPIELKTGKAPHEGIWPGHRIQLGAYALLLEEYYNTTIKEGFVVYLDAKERRQVSVNTFLRLEVKELIRKVQEILNSIDLPCYIGNMNKCNACSLKPECYNEDFMNQKMSGLPFANAKTLNTTISNRY